MLAPQITVGIARVRHSAGASLSAISIHALREEGDPSTPSVCAAIPYFYPRPPRGGRLWSCWMATAARYFYPRPPRGGRQGRFHGMSCSFYFYPRPPRGGRRAPLLTPRDSSRISIHALREEGDLNDFTKRGILIIFLSTPSARRATCMMPRWTTTGSYFYPRPPRGGRQRKT